MTLWRWLQRYEPAAAAVVFDPPGRTHRHALYAEYKAQRPPRPPELSAQLPRLHTALAAFGMPIVEVPGWEADDVLATLVRHFETRGDTVLLARVTRISASWFPSACAGAAALDLGIDEEMGPSELRRRSARPGDRRPDGAVRRQRRQYSRGRPGERRAALVREHGSLASYSGLMRWRVRRARAAARRP
jgi:hypothetical protein